MPRTGLLNTLDDARPGDVIAFQPRAVFSVRETTRYSIERLRVIRWLRQLLLLTLFVTIAAALQRASGAWESEFGGHPDEPAHYITGLMVRDYVAHGLGSRPMPFARDYYEHYPKVALGNWPPGFYVIQAAWTLPFSPQRGSLLLLMALLAGFVAWAIAYALEIEFGLPTAMVAALLFLALPVVQIQTGMVMTEIPVTLFMLLATLAFGRFVETERTRDALAFGFLASAAILTKGSGLALAFVPPMALMFSRRWHLLKTRKFWYPAVIVLVLCGPWTALTLGLARAGWEEGGFSLRFTRLALPFYGRTAYLNLGFALTVTAVIGIIVKLWPYPKEKRPSGLWSAMGAVFFAVWLFQSLVPCGLDERHFVPALAAAVMFVLAGAQRAAQYAEARNLPWLRPAVYGALIVFFVIGPFRIPRKDYRGLGTLAHQLSVSSGRHDVLFISSDATGEGIFISEVAMREARPGHKVVRSSKLLASSTWGGGDYKAKVAGPQDVLAALEMAQVRYVVVDHTLPEGRKLPHHQLLEKTLAEMPTHFELMSKASFVRNGRAFADGLELWRLIRR